MERERRNIFLDCAVSQHETFETSRARVMKGIVGRIPASKFERRMRRIRAARKAAS